MRDREEQYTVSTSHVGLRLAGLIAAVGISIAAFSFCFVQISQKKPGYYEIEPDVSEEASFYRNGFTLIYYFDGTSNEIKAEMNRLKDVYGSMLLYSYKLLDADNTYEGFVNMASLNDSLGDEVTVSGDLRDILQDLWDKTGEGRGVNLFSGSLLREWDSILSLDDISEFDPALHPEIAGRLRELAEETADTAHFSFEISDDARSIRLTASEQYLSFLEKNGYSTRILTAGRMADAYRLKMIRDALVAQGFQNGYLNTDSGLTLALPEYGEGKYALYGYKDGQIARCAELEAGNNSACSFLRTFPMRDGEIMYHAEGYHPYFVLNTGGFANVLSSSCAVRYDGDIVEACYENIALYNMSDRSQIEAAGPETMIACTFLEEPDVPVYFNKMRSEEK